MGLKTKIEYLAKGGSTHNFWIGGCDKASEGCKNCFAETMYKRFFGKDFSVPIKSKNFDAPLKWKKPRVILVNDMGDFCHHNICERMQLDALQVMFHSTRHIFLILTKRADELARIFTIYGKAWRPFYSHIWLGVSVENQEQADKRIPELLKIPHFKKWVSVEPMLDRINIRYDVANLNWVVCGGETGKGARYMCDLWARELKDHCKKAGTPFFMKQMSNREPIPKDLMVREYPPEIEDIKKLYENNPTNH